MAPAISTKKYFLRRRPTVENSNQVNRRSQRKVRQNTAITNNSTQAPELVEQPQVVAESDPNPVEISVDQPRSPQNLDSNEASNEPEQIENQENVIPEVNNPVENVIDNPENVVPEINNLEVNIIENQQNVAPEVDNPVEHPIDNQENIIPEINNLAENILDNQENVNPENNIIDDSVNAAIENSVFHGDTIRVSNSGIRRVAKRRGRKARKQLAIKAITTNRSFLTLPYKKRLIGNPTVDVTQWYSCERADRDIRKRMIRNWYAAQEDIKNEPFNVPFVYFNGPSQTYIASIQRGDTIHQMLDKSLVILHEHHPELGTLYINDLMFVKNGFIIPKTYSFYDFANNNIGGTEGIQFHTAGDITDIDNPDVDIGKIVLKSWYEENQDTSPMNEWKVFDPFRMNAVLNPPHPCSLQFLRVLHY